MVFRERRVSENVLGAIAIVIIGRWLIRLISKVITKAMERQKVKPTWFAALTAALGIAIGAAWGGLLSNFAAGVRSIGLFKTTIDSPDNVLAVRPYVHNDHRSGSSSPNTRPRAIPETVSYSKR